MNNLITFTENLHEGGSGFRALTDAIDTTTPDGRLYFYLMASLVQMERELATERIQAGPASARAHGRLPGRNGK